MKLLICVLNSTAVNLNHRWNLGKDDYIPLFDTYVIAYPVENPDASLAYFC